MRIGVLAAADSWYFKDLARAAGPRRQVTAVSFSQIAAELGLEGATRLISGMCALEQFDALLVRTMPPGSLEQIVFRMDVLGRVEAAGCIVINPARAIEAAVDKYLASARLQAAGLPTPPTLVCQTVEQAMIGFEQLGGDVVLKPLFGSEGRGITRLSDPELALRAFKTLVQLDAVIYMQRFIQHEGFDLRLFVLGEQVWGMRRRNAQDWRTNVSRGATTEPIDVNDRFNAMARQAAGSVGAFVAGVDILPARDGVDYVLEVNAVPGWRALASTLNLDLASLVLDYVETIVRRQTDHRSQNILSVNRAAGN